MALTPSPNRLAGAVTMSIGGATYAVASGAEYQCSGFNVETLSGQSGVDGTKEMPKAGMIKAKLRDNGALSTAQLAALRNTPVVLVAANGKTVSGAGMWWVGEMPSVNTEDGTFDAEFQGTSVSEQTT